MENLQKLGAAIQAALISLYLPCCVRPVTEADGMDMSEPMLIVETKQLEAVYLSTEMRVTDVQSALANLLLTDAQKTLHYIAGHVHQYPQTYHELASEDYVEDFVSEYPVMVASYVVRSLAEAHVYSVLRQFYEEPHYD